MRTSWLPIPVSSQPDDDEKPEGSIDPLGTYGLADALATKIGSSGVRERQSNLRFLTICSLGWSLIEAMDPRIEPGDRNSTPEQAFEWLVLESLVRKNMKDHDRPLRIPGILKAEECIKRGMPINADRYLRTPRTFGFYGVYRTLAAYLGMVSLKSDFIPLLDTNGAILLEAWRKDKDLPGFRQGASGPGSEQFKEVRKHLEATWKSGQAVRSAATESFINSYLHPGDAAGPNETHALHEILFTCGATRDDANRRFLLRCVEDRKLIEAVVQSGLPWEPEFHKAIRIRAVAAANHGLVEVLDAIDAYEDFIGPLTDAFDAIRRALTLCRSSVDMAQLAPEIPQVPEISATLPSAYIHALDALARVNLGSRFADQFSVFSTSLRTDQFVETLIAYHEQIQKRKSPAGKAPWFEVHNGRLAVRPLYRLEGLARDRAAYVYAYRSLPLRNFIESLGGAHGE